MKNLAGLMKQATQMQSKMQEMQAKLEAMEMQGASGAGMVTVTMSGRGELKRISIDPKITAAADREMLEDLIVAAHADAKRKIDEMMSREMEQATGGMQLPAGMKFPF